MARYYCKGYCLGHYRLQPPLEVRTGIHHHLPGLAVAPVSSRPVAQGQGLTILVYLSADTRRLSRQMGIATTIIRLLFTSFSLCRGSLKMLVSRTSY